MAININEVNYNPKGFILVSWDRFHSYNLSSFILQVSSVIPYDTLTNIIVSDSKSVSCQFPYFIPTNDKCTITIFAYDNNGLISGSTSKSIPIHI
ncbi:hypothetical protein [Xenorhabdus stockiae]|uniref:hypothetical protein n=1 Tax=Xenorhabdus stockiae TaxID=351614 RepID=UPI004064B322